MIPDPSSPTPPHALSSPVTSGIHLSSCSRMTLCHILLLSSCSVRYLGMLEAQFSSRLNATADLLTLLLFGVVNVLLLDYFLVPPQGFYGVSIVFMCIYVWSRADPFAEVTFYGFSFKAWHTPFLFLVTNLLVGGNFMLDLIGIGIGHLYFFLVDLVPRNWGYTLLWTPQWMIRAVQLAEAKFAGVPVQQSTAAPRPNWQQGQGYRLG